MGAVPAEAVEAGGLGAGGAEGLVVGGTGAVGMGRCGGGALGPGGREGVGFTPAVAKVVEVVWAGRDTGASSKSSSKSGSRIE